MNRGTIKTRKKRITPRTPKSLDEKFYGPEPIWDTDIEPTLTEISKAYNWYNYFYDKNNVVKLLFDHYPRNKKELVSLKKLQPWQIPTTICYQARMMARGCKFPESSIQFFNEKVQELLNRSKKIKENNSKKIAKKLESQNEKIKEKISDSIAMLEEELDRFTSNKYNSDFNMYTWLQVQNIKASHVTTIVTYYQRLLAELIEAKTKKDTQLNEAYAFMKKTELNRYIEFVSGIINDCETWSSNQKKVRKTRKRKPPSVEKIVSKIQYLKEYKDYQLVSINPSDIIKAQELWVFNVKYRTASRYLAATDEGFSMKGTTLCNFNETSAMKKIRKPETVLPKILNSGKRVLGKVFNEINSKEQKVNGRINRDCIILRAVK